MESEKQTRPIPLPFEISKFKSVIKGCCAPSRLYFTPSLATIELATDVPLVVFNPVLSNSSRYKCWPFAPQMIIVQPSCIGAVIASCRRRYDLAHEYATRIINAVLSEHLPEIQSSLTRRGMPP